MTRPQVRGLFVTGTGTEVGKTFVAAAIAKALAAAGRRVGVYKPAASGCRLVEGRLQSDDAIALWEAAGRPGELEQVCPQRFAAPLAPHLAARAEGREIDAKLLRSGLDAWTASSEIVVVEGAGGLLSPLSDDEYVADLAADFGFPLIVVAANVLGTIHQMLATLVVAETFPTPLDVAGVVLNHPFPEPPDASCGTNFAELTRRCVPPVLAEVGWQDPGSLAAIDWYALATKK
ncbi:MAG TPA: dethiobiotin synthase [Pirellulales bacterium]|nr:dethiobiotin synthase [Pirellulales bacterium]